jgi:ribosomal protein S19
MIKNSLQKKIKYVNKDFLNFVIPTNNKLKTQIENLTKNNNKDLSEYQLQNTKNVIYITKIRNTSITPLLQNLVKKNKLDLRVYNGKKFFNISKRFLVNGLKFGEYVFTRVNRRHILKVRTQKKATPTKKK